MLWLLDCLGVGKRTFWRPSAMNLSCVTKSEWPFGKRIPAITQCRRRVWDQVIPFFAYPNEIRKMISPTNAIESLHMQLRKVLKTRGHFPSDEPATKLIYLVLRDITKKWTNPPITWKLAATQFAIRFGQRFFAVEI